MTDAALGALPVAAADELESPARRALRRLVQRKGAVAGLVVIAVFIVLALFAPWIAPYDPIATSWTWCASRRRRCTGSAPTISAAISSAA